VSYSTKVWFEDEVLPTKRCPSELMNVAPLLNDRLEGIAACVTESFEKFRYKNEFVLALPMYMPSLLTKTYLMAKHCLSN
jgi:hypothetical protein